jgi:hypothetical protein
MHNFFDHVNKFIPEWMKIPTIYMTWSDTNFAKIPKK